MTRVPARGPPFYRVVYQTAAGVAAHFVERSHFERVAPDPARAGERCDWQSGSFEQQQVLLRFPEGLAPAVAVQTLVERRRRRCGARLQVVLARLVLVVRQLTIAFLRVFGRVQQRHRVPVDHVRVEQLVAEFRVRHSAESVILTKQTTIRYAIIQRQDNDIIRDSVNSNDQHP